MSESEGRKAPFPRRKRGDAGTRIFLAVFLAGYVFFLSSNLWMPVSGNAERLTPIGQTSEYEGRRVTLISWTYGTSQEEMEVEIEVVNRRFDGIDTYAFSAVEQKGSVLDVRTVVSDPDYVVLRITGLPERWSEVSLRMQLPEAGDEPPLRLYTNTVDVEKTESLPELDRTGYLIRRTDKQAALYADEIEQLKAAIETEKAYQASCKEEIDRLKAQRKYQTEEEIEETEELIREAEYALATSETTVEQNEHEIEELQQKIENCKIKKESLSKEG